MIQNLVSENARVAQDQEDYQKRYDALMERYDSVQASIDEVAGQIVEREAKAIRLTEFAKELKERDSLITEFDSRLWGSLVESVTIGKDKEMMFRFRDGTEIIV
jgi:chromosome segregation ATPase